MPFCLSTSFISIFLYIFKFTSSFDRSFFLYSGLIILGTSFFIWFKKINEESITKKLILNFSTTIFLSSLLLIVIFNFKFFSPDESLEKINTLLTVITSISGFLIFYTDRKAILHDSNIDTKNISASSKKWIHIGLLVLILGIGSYLRVKDLDYFEPYADEYPHLIYAQALYDTGEKTIEYDEKIQPYNRANILTYLVYGSFKVFGADLFSARLVGAVAGVLLIFLIYLFCKKINKNIALLCGFVFAIHPWAIAISRNVREYAIFPIFYLLFSMYLIHLYPIIIRIFETLKITKKEILLLLPTLLPIAYIFLDYNSTFKQIVLLYFVFGIILYFSIFLNKNINSKIKTFISLSTLAILGIGLIVFKTLNLSFINTSLQPDLFWFYLYLSNNLTQPFYNTNIYLSILFIIFGSLYLIYITKKQKIGGLFTILSFIIILLFFILFFGRYNQKRYASFDIVWFSIILATGYYSIIKILLYIFKNKYLKSFLFIFSIGLIGLTINWSYIPSSSNLINGSKAIITNEYHDKYSLVINQFGKEIKKDDVIICGLCGPIFWNKQVEYKNNHVYKYDYTDPVRFDQLNSILEIHEHGWLILDSRRGGTWGEGYSKIKAGNYSLPSGKIISLTNLSDDEWRIFKW